MKKIGVLLLLTTVGTVSKAQEPTACDSLIQHGLSNIAYSTDQSTYLNRLAYNFCKADYSSASNSEKHSLDVTYESFRGAYGGAEMSASEFHSSQCTDLVQQVDVYSDQAVYAQTIYQGAVNAWNQCMTLALRQLETNLNVSPDQTVADISLRYGGPGSNFTVNGVNAPNFKCTNSGKTLDADENIAITSNSTSIHCERVFKTVSVGGADSQFFPAARITIETDFENIIADFAALIGEPGRTRLNNIEAKIVAVQDDLNGRFEKLGTWPSGAPPYREDIIDDSRAKNRTSGTCPDGQYVAGMQIVDKDDGGACTTCISGVQLVCRPLNR